MKGGGRQKRTTCRRPKNEVKKKKKCMSRNSYDRKEGGRRGERGERRERGEREQKKVNRKKDRRLNFANLYKTIRARPLDQRKTTLRLTPKLIN